MNPDIDYQEGIFFEVLERQFHQSASYEPVLLNYWVCEIIPHETPKILKLIKNEFNSTSEQVKHLKRMQKTKNSNDETMLKVLLCPESTKEEETMGGRTYSVTILQNLLKQYGLSEFTITKHKIPINKPIDKDTNILWSEKYWPILWKGNPVFQELDEIYKNIQFEKVQKYVQMVTELSSSNKFNTPIVTIFVDPKTEEIKSINYDERTADDPINHTVMRCISDVADSELKRRTQQSHNDKSENNYLCLNYHVYTTHEPCIMCSMALVHSRISQLVYIRPSPKTGGIGKTSGSGEMIHISCSLNWKYEAFRYIDDNVVKSVEVIDETIYV